MLDGDISIADQDGATLLLDVVAVRTRFFDGFFADAAQAGIRQAVILASGLDTRDASRDSALPRTPGTKRVIASIIVAAGNSPPVST